MDALTATLTLPMSLAFSAGLYGLAAKATKAVLWSTHPLSAGEPQAFTYERDVWRTPEMAVQQVIVLVGLAGLVVWLGGVLGQRWLALLGVFTWAGALALDLLRWERVAVSAQHLWFQRGFGQRVHQVAYENIRDVAVEERDVRFFTLRRGLAGRICRLQVRMNDKRVVALPKTDAHSGGADVEAVANQVRQRLVQLGDRRAVSDSAARGSAVAAAAAAQPPSDEAELRLALRRLRQQALTPELSKAVKLPQNP